MRHVPAATFAAAFALSACNQSAPAEEETVAVEPTAPTSVEVVDASGAPIGTVTISEDNNGTTLDLAVESASLAEGMHGVHLHEAGLCATPDFKSAGGHFNPTGASHGRDNPAGAHVGDLANLGIDTAGKGRSTYLVTGSLMAGGDHPLADADGTALVIHEGADDYATDPSGDSGARVACAVIAAPQA